MIDLQSLEPIVSNTYLLTNNLGFFELTAEKFLGFRQYRALSDDLRDRKPHESKSNLEATDELDQLLLC